MHLHALAEPNAIKICCAAVEGEIYFLWRNIKNKASVTSTSTVNVALQRLADYFILFIRPTYFCLPFSLIFNVQRNKSIIMLGYGELLIQHGYILFC